VSYQATKWAWEQHTSSASRKCLLVAIANFADADGFCVVSQEALAEMTDQKERALRDNLHILEEAGFFKRVERRRDDGARLEDGYQLPFRTKHQAVTTREKPTVRAAQALPADSAGSESGKPASNAPRVLPAESAGYQAADSAGATGEQPAESAGNIKTSSSKENYVESNNNTNAPDGYASALRVIREAGALEAWRAWIVHTQAATSTQRAQAPHWAAWITDGKLERLRVEAMDVIALGTSVVHPWAVLRSRMTKPVDTRSQAVRDSTGGTSAPPPNLMPGAKLTLPNGDECLIVHVKPGTVVTDHPQHDRIPFGLLRQWGVIPSDR